MAKGKSIESHPELGLPEVRKPWQTEGLFSDHYLKARIQKNNWWPSDEQARSLWLFCQELFNKRARWLAERGNEQDCRREPFFVHSDLTTAVQLADIVGYCLNWGVRLNRMTEPTRKEIEPLGKMAFDLRYVGKRTDEMTLKDWAIYGIFYIEDLRPKWEREAEQEI
jgi:hypothetical protein